MSNKNIEMMKKIIEEKKKKSAEQGSVQRTNVSTMNTSKAFKQNKKGGLFDK